METLLKMMSKNGFADCCYRLPGHFRTLSLLVMVLMSCVALTPCVGFAQSKKDDKPEVAEPENITLETKDHVLLKCTYYAGPESKNTVPMILLHDWEGERKDFAVLAKMMQEEYGRSVIIPDLRGHGKSVEVRGVDKPLELSRFKKNEIAAILNDIEACKKFLVQRNNAGELNINMLIVGAVGKMNVHALQWTLTDWSYGPPIGGIKQGQDVQGLLMFGPQRKLKNLSLVQNLKTPLVSGKGVFTLPMLMVWGSKNSTEAKEGKAIFSALEKSRPDDSTENKDFWKRDLFQMVYKTNRDAVQMIGSTDKGTQKIAKGISDFIDGKVKANEEDFRWGSRAKKK